MALLHKRDLIHGDLTSQNILIDENKLPVISDFGSSRKVKPEERLRTGDLGTPNYLAPEFIQAQYYDRKVDVYSYGMILWEMIVHEIPFQGHMATQCTFDRGCDPSPSAELFFASPDGKTHRGSNFIELKP
jgi:serine/threonine protein kinase